MNKVSGNYNQKQINKLSLIVRDINHHYEDLDSLGDDKIKAKTQEFKDRLQKGETLDDILPEAFAVVKQAAKRMCGKSYDVKGDMLERNMIHYDVQLIGGIALHNGQITEMRTGEGKTLVATLPVYLNALEGKGAHVVTVNDYLASRDAAWMGHLYEWLGLSVGCVVKSTALENRSEEYAKDVTYMENSELGFDYLRDNLVRSKKQRSLLIRSLNFAIIDEVDSILIDEARTPLIISEAKEEATEKYEYYAKIVKMLTPCSEKKKISKGLLHELLNESKNGKQEEDGDYYIDEKTKTVSLSGVGIDKLEKTLGVENLYKDIGYEEIHHIENALRAGAVYDIDKEYIVKDGEVLIVDEHTGRTMPGRRFSEGLHQAIEAKENAQIRRESKTIATITYQNFFKQYDKLAGMTGTALTEAEEFNKIYELEVLSIPTNEDLIRVDQNDLVYFNQNAKRKAIKEDIKFYNQIGQPILIGTANILTSEYVSKLLTKEGINHYVLNAKHHEQEAHIVANAGKFSSVVVATNMAGRGTDVKLDNNLNPKMALNYAKWIKKNIHNRNVKIQIFSEKEFDLTIDGLENTFGLSHKKIRQAEKGWIVLDDETLININFSRTKKERKDVYVNILFRHKDKHSELAEISKEAHYGLFVLGTEKHESRRIDNQLRGRAGRQGDPGRSIFYVALDDLLMRKIGGEKIQSIAKMLLGAKDLEKMTLTQKQFTNSIVRAQTQMEAWHFSTRKHLFDYDTVIDKQRQRVYTRRNQILDSEDSEELQKEFIIQAMQDIQENVKFVIDNKVKESHNLKQGKNEMLASIIKELNIRIDEKESKKLESIENNKISTHLTKLVKSNTIKKMETLDTGKMHLILKDVYLHFLDKLRIDHIDEMQYLRDKVGLMGYAQQDPLIIYKKESFEKFQILISMYKTETSVQLMNINYSKFLEQEDLKPIVIDASDDEATYMAKLKGVSKGIRVPPPSMNNDIANKKNDTKKIFFQDEDGIEVFEASDESATQKNTDTTSYQAGTKKKIRPNDRINVKYSNGKIEYDVKYKKVKEKVKSGEAEII